MYDGGGDERERVGEVEMWKGLERREGKVAALRREREERCSGSIKGLWCSI